MRWLQGVDSVPDKTMAIQGILENITKSPRLLPALAKAWMGGAAVLSMALKNQLAATPEVRQGLIANGVEGLGQGIGRGNGRKFAQVRGRGRGRVAAAKRRRH